MSSAAPPPANGSAEILDGCVVSEHTTATEIGIKLFERGGNAVDAIVGTILAVETLCPYHSGIGGGGFALVRTPDGQKHALSFRGAAPVSSICLEAATHLPPTYDSPSGADADTACYVQLAWSSNATYTPSIELPYFSPAREFEVHHNHSSLHRLPQVDIADASLVQAAATPQFYQNGASTQRGGSAVAVPGELKGLKALHERFGRLDWKTVVQPSVDLARDGFDFFADLYEVRLNLSFHDTNALSPTDRQYIDKCTVPPGSGKLAGSIYENDPFYATLFEDGKILPMDQGRVWSRPEYAQTISVLAEEGTEPFYTGRIAEAIVKVVQERGGLLTMEDMKSAFRTTASNDATCPLTRGRLQSQVARRHRSRLQGRQAVLCPRSGLGGDVDVGARCFVALQIGRRRQRSRHAPHDGSTQSEPPPLRRFVPSLMRYSWPSVCARNWATQISSLVSSTSSYDGSVRRGWKRGPR